MRAEYELAIVWTSTHLATHMSDLIESLGLANRVRHLERVSTAELVSLYSGATVFVFPSLAEGFGLPLLEAMACGTPVIASNNTSIPEIVDSAALLVEGESAASIAEAMRTVLSSEALRDKLSMLGRRRAADFSWKKCARETVAAYGAAVSRPILKTHVKARGGK
jgi:glycosyltransferase involved in cell wall biosynthesis